MEGAGDVRGWRAKGATHVLVNTMRAGLNGVDEHVRVLAEVAAALGLSPRGRQPGGTRARAV